MHADATVLTGWVLFAACIFSFVFGSVIGSFLNVVIYRVPRDESIVRPRSSCPKCGHLIRWYDNIPVAGYAALKGKCRDCGEPIAVRYPLVEALTGVLFVGGLLVFGLSARLPLVWGFLSVLLAITFIDLDLHIIPDRIVLPAALGGLAYSIALEPSKWWQFVVAGGAAALFLFLIALVWSGGMGMGDVKLALLMGFVLGREVVVSLFIAFLAGGAIGIVLLTTGKKGRKDRVAFGPFLAFGAACGVFFGSAITNWYLGLF